MAAPVTDPDVGSHERARDVPGVALLVLAGWVAWRPAETFPSTAVLVAAVLLALTVWGWQRTSAAAGNGWLTAAGAGCVLTASGLSGWDGSSAIKILSLIAAVAALIWLASREEPSRSWPAVLALVISGLVVWGIWQVTVGAEKAALNITELPESIQFEAAERLASGRAFASQILPSHLAILLATALPASPRARAMALERGTLGGWFGVECDGVVVDPIAGRDHARACGESGARIWSRPSAFGVGGGRARDGPGSRGCRQG